MSAVWPHVLAFCIAMAITLLLYCRSEPRWSLSRERLTGVVSIAGYLFLFVAVGGELGSPEPLLLIGSAIAGTLALHALVRIGVAAGGWLLDQALPERESRSNSPDDREPRV